MWLALKAVSWQVKAGILVGLLAILAAITFVAYNKGYSKGENISRVEIAKYETRVKELTIERDKAQAKVDIHVITEYKDRIQYVDRVQYKTRTVVETVVPEQFKLSKGWIYAYNQSVAADAVDPALAGNPNPSAVSERSALVTITENNSVCLSNQAQLDALQSWIRETEKARVQVTK